MINDFFLKIVVKIKDIFHLFRLKCEKIVHIENINH
jgi:hypothetical protein